MQEIIVYRNPMEAAFWNSMSNGGAPIFFTAILLGIFWAVVYTIAEKLYDRLTIRSDREIGRYAMWTSNILTFSVAVFLHFEYMV